MDKCGTKTTNKTGQAVLLFFLVWQMVFLAMTLTKETEGLAWASLDFDCDSGAESTVEYFGERVCIFTDTGSSDSRECHDYDDSSAFGIFANDIKDSEDNFNACKGLAGCMLFFTLLQLLLVAVGLASPPTGKPWCRGSFIMKALFSAINFLTILFLISAAGSAGDAEGMDIDSAGCDETVGLSYGMGICAFLIFWVFGHWAIFFGLVPGLSMPVEVPAPEGEAQPQTIKAVEAES